MAHLAIELPADMVAGLRAAAQAAVAKRDQRVANALFSMSVDDASVTEARHRLAAVAEILETNLCWPENETDHLVSCMTWDVKRILSDWTGAPGKQFGTPREPNHTPGPFLSTLCAFLLTFAGLNAEQGRSSYSCPCVYIKGFVSPAWEAKSRSGYASAFHQTRRRALEARLARGQVCLDSLRTELGACEAEYARVRDSLEELRAIISAYTEPPQTPEPHAAPDDNAV